MKKLLKRPVYDLTAWLAIAAVYVPSFLIMNVALAQTMDPQSFPMGPLTSTGTTSPENYTIQPFPFPTETQPIQPLPGQFPPIENASGTQPMMPSFPQQNPGTFQPAPMPAPMSCPEGVICSGERQRNEAEQARMEQERMKGMKSQLNGFAQGMKMAKSQVNRLKKQGVTPPEELVAALSNVDEIVAKIKNAQTPDEIDSMQEDIQKSVEAVQEWMPKLPMLMELPRIVKQADKEIAKLNKAYKADERKVRSKKILADELKDFRTAIDNHQKLLNEIKALSKTDPEEAVSKMHDDFYPGLDDVWQNEKILQIGLNFKSGLTKINNEIRNSEKQIKKLKAQKIDTAELESDLKDIKNQFAEAKKIYSTKPLDADALIDSIEEVMDSAQEFANKVEDLTGDTEYEPTLKNKAVEVNLPDVFKNFADRPQVEQ